MLNPVNDTAWVFVLYETCSRREMIVKRLVDSAEEKMHAKPGDYLKISGHKVGETARHAEILEVRGDKGGPPYYVRWPDGHESLVYPGPDIVIEHKRRKATAG